MGANKEKYKLEHLLKFQNTCALSLWYLIQDTNIKSFHYNINDLNFFIREYRSSTPNYFPQLFKKCAESHGYVDIFLSNGNNGFNFKINTTYFKVKIFMRQMEKIFVINIYKVYKINIVYRLGTIQAYN